jgi:hypothetical protein
MKLLCAPLFIALLALALPAQGGTILTTALTGQGNASGFVVINLNGQQGALELTFSLSSPIANGSGIFDSTETTLLYPLTIPFPATSVGTIDQVVTFSSLDLPALLAGDLYFDVVSQNFPTLPGEIGGELTVAPEPASIVLLGLGLAWIAWRLGARCAIKT